MSDNSSGEKTEQPTPKKLRDAKDKGQVAKSKEVVSTALVISVFFLLYGFSDHFQSTFAALILLPEKFISAPFDEALYAILEGMIVGMLELIAPLLALVFSVAILAHFIQYGFVFSGESVKPDIKKINPVEGFKKIFSMKSLIEFIKSIIKVALLSFLVWVVIEGNIRDLLRLPECGLRCLLPFSGHLMTQLMLISFIGLIIISFADYAFEKYHHTKDLKMTKDEVKREYKEMEGSPEIKSRRRQLHQELQSSSNQDNVKRSSVVVTNPTHIAIGLYYEKGETPLPVITFKETDAIAKQLIKVAQEENIPVLQRVPLARALYHDGHLDQYIPTELIEPVAEVLRWVDALSDDESKTH